MKTNLKLVKPKNESFADFRRKGIGSSDASAVMGASPWCTPYQLWEQKTGRAGGPEMNFQMRRGIELEPYARQSYENETGIRMPTERMIHKEHDFVRAHFDGINKLARLVLEIKCSGRIDHEKAMSGKIPDKYLWQCVHLLAVSGLPMLHYWSFDGENGVLVKFKRDKALEEKLLIQETIFWGHVTTDKAPKVDLFKIRRNR